MKNTQPFLPGLHLASLRKKPRSTAQKCLDEEGTFSAVMKNHLRQKIMQGKSGIIGDSRLKNMVAGQVLSRPNIYGPWPVEYDYWSGELLSALGGVRFQYYGCLDAGSRTRPWNADLTVLMYDFFVFKTKNTHGAWFFESYRAGYYLQLTNRAKEFHNYAVFKWNPKK